MADNAQSILRRLRDLYSNPRGSLEQLVDQLNNFNKGRVAVINDRGAGYRNLSQEERVKQIVQGALDNVGSGGLGALGVIKTKGGNWLTGSVENALKGLKRPDERALAANYGYAVNEPSAIRTSAINNWIEGPLTKYVKRDMATEGDPVRKLAEQGILHYTPDNLDYPASIVMRRREIGGFPMEGVGVSPQAVNWEKASDRSVYQNTAFQRGLDPDIVSANPWMNKLDPDTQVYEMGLARDLGFGHLTDELSNALNPESGLPRHLLLTPEQMQQMGMEKAVRHVDAINKWRAVQKAEANAKLAQSPAVHIVREYAENNPKGLRWVELKSPDRWPEGIDPLAKEEFGDLGRYSRKTLGDQLKYEGDTMGHCVGGYCDDVVSGRSRIFSLRDAKGEPHVTIETRPDPAKSNRSIDVFRRELGREPQSRQELEDFIVDNGGDFANSPTNSIIQIKGKQNLKPKDEYLPFVQDFVRNHPEGGKWGDIGDFSNTGLERLSDYKQAVQDAARAKYPESNYLTPDELQEFVDAQFQTPRFAGGGQVKLDNAAQGQVTANTTWRPMELGGIIGYITE